MVNASNPDYASVNGVLFNKNLTTLIDYPITVAGPYNIPASVTTIGESAFENALNLTSITIPQSVTDIEPDAFRHCYDLMEATIPNGVTNIGAAAFYGSGLVRVTIGSEVTSLDIDTFSASVELQAAYFLGNAPDSESIRRIHR